MASWSQASWEAYLKAADQQQAGSNVSTATGSSTSTTSSTTLLLPGDIRRLGSDPVLSDRKRSGGDSRTPLRAQARPFVSSMEPRPFGVYATSPLGAHATKQWWAPAVAPTGKPQGYNEEVQEDVYLSQNANSEAPSVSSKLPYSETLQEGVYLGFEPADAAGLLSKAGSDAANWLFSTAETIADNLMATQIPTKHTFIHYDICQEPDSDSDNLPGDRQATRLRKSTSAPSILMCDAFQLLPQKETMAELHVRGECSPCAYFYHKVDGCRKGNECVFCHLCTGEEMKNRRKRKEKVIKARKLLDKNRAALNAEESTLALEVPVVGYSAGCLHAPISQTCGA